MCRREVSVHPNHRVTRSCHETQVRFGQVSILSPLPFSLFSLSPLFSLPSSLSPLSLDSPASSVSLFSQTVTAHCCAVAQCTGNSAWQRDQSHELISLSFPQESFDRQFTETAVSTRLRSTCISKHASVLVPRRQGSCRKDSRRTGVQLAVSSSLCGRGHPPDRRTVEKDLVAPL